MSGDRLYPAVSDEDVGSLNRPFPIEHAHVTDRKRG